MKRIVFVLLIAVTALGLSSCRKSGVGLFAGDYSFKTSGEVTLTAQAEVNGNNVIVPAVMNAGIADEIGQINISPTDNDDEVLVVINHMGGDVITTYGTCERNTIVLDDFRRNTLPISINGLLSNETYITVSAVGTMYEGDMIVFDVSLSGRCTIGSATFKIRDKNVKTVAYRN